jgi:hypothetical protein
MARQTGRFKTSSKTGETVRAFIPHPLPPAEPAIDLADFAVQNREAELALVRLSGLVGLVASVD